MIYLKRCRYSIAALLISILITLTAGGNALTIPDGIVDNADPEFSVTGRWGTALSTVLPGVYGADFRYHAGNPGNATIYHHPRNDKAIWNAELTDGPGYYIVKIRYPACPLLATNAPFTINHNGESETILVDQRRNGGKWLNLGIYYFADDGTENIALSDNADSWVVADVVSFTPTSPPPPPNGIVDNFDPKFSLTGKWPTSSNTNKAPDFFGIDFRYHAPGDGSETVRWDTELIDGPGLYEVFVWYPISAKLATNAPFTINHNGISDTVLINQGISGGKWVSLGSYEFADDGTENITLSDNADSWVVADVVSFIATPTSPSIIDNSKIEVFGTVWNVVYSPDNTIDDDLSTFWHGTNDIQIDMTNFLAYHFSSSYGVTRIDFFDDYTNSYNMGELDIQISQNSTNGLDGDWTTIDHIAGDFSPTNGDFTRLVDIGSTSWIRLFMNYQGRAAYGSTPAFYLSEIDFYTNTSPPPPPPQIDSVDPSSGSANSDTDITISGYNFATDAEVFLNKGGPSIGSVGFSGGGDARGVYVSGSYAYVYAAYAELFSIFFVIDISTPSSPAIIGSVGLSGDARGVYVSGSYAYVVEDVYTFGEDNTMVTGRLQVIDISTPSSPSIISSVELGYVVDLINKRGTTKGIHVSGSYAYMTYFEVRIERGITITLVSRLCVIDISDPASPYIVGFVDIPRDAQDVYVSGSHAYVTNSSSLQVIDISTPSSPAIIGSVDTQGYGYRDVYVSGTYAYVAGGDSGLQVIDISTPSSPAITASVDTPGSARDVYVSGTYAYVADLYSGLQVIDISTPSNPAIIGSVDTPAGSAEGVYVSVDHAYVADGDSGLQIIMTPIQLDINVIDSTTITATVPANLPPGVYDIIVVNPGGGRDILPNGFEVF